MVRIFERLGLWKNRSKTKSMVCKPRFVWGQQGVEAYKRRATGEVPIFWYRNITRVGFEECGGTMASSYLHHHMERSHGIVLPQIRGVDVGGGWQETYTVSFPRILKSVEFPVEGCLAREKTPGRLREHLMYRHWKLKVAIM